MSISFQRVRAQVTEYWSEEPITNQELAQQAAEHAKALPRVPYPPAKAVDPGQGIWDLYLPEELVRGLDAENATTLVIDTAGYYFRVRFLDRD